MKRFFLFAVVLAATSASAQQPVEHRLFPQRTYDTAVPAPTATLGYELGKHIATYDKVLPYFQQLAAATRRVTFQQHGESYEGRPIFHVAITSPENHARIAQIRANLAKLADPRSTNAQEVDNIVRNTPVAVMLVFGTDGAETAGPEAAMHVAYQLAAANDAATQALLRDAVVIIVPAQNPDANQRTVAWYNAFRVGPNGTADPDAAEHHFPWGINSNNHYQNDPNRESVWNILRESQVMAALYRQWQPQVYVDNHGEHAQYTGPWYVEPLHEVLTPRQREWHRKFGEALQAEFGQRRYEYAPWEYGQFDPGYWDTYPNFSGSIAWTTETTGGGSRGLRIERRNGAPYTLADGAIQHVLASDVTVRMAVANREQLLRDFFRYKQSAIEEGARAEIKTYAISARNDPANLATVVNIMLRNGIDVWKTTRPVPVRNMVIYGTSGRTADTLPAGSYILPMAQPQGRMLRVLLERNANFAPEFTDRVMKAEAARDSGRAAARLFYDITAWSIPHSYNLRAYGLRDSVATAGSIRVTAPVRLQGTVVNPDAPILMIDYSSSAALKALARLRRDSIVHRIATEATTLGNRWLPSGSILLFRADNPTIDLPRLASALAEDTGVDVIGLQSSRTPTVTVNKPGKIAVVMDRPVSPASYGHIWYTFEQRYGIDFTALNFERLANANLDRYAVLILPDGNYGSVHRALATDIAAKLRAWVEKGGTLIGMRGASAWIATPENNLTAARMRQPASPRLPAVPGAIFDARVNAPAGMDHPLYHGYDSFSIPVMVWSALAFDPAAPVEQPLIIREKLAGFAYRSSLAHVIGTPYVVRDRRGSGEVVLFLDDPNFRLFWDGLTRLFFNAVLLGDR